MLFWKKRRYRYLFFDLDHTLWDFNTNAREAIYDAFLGFGFQELKIDYNAFYETYVKHNHRLWDEYEAGNLKKEVLRSLRFHLTFKDFGINDYTLAERFGEAYITLCPKKTALFPGVMELLDYLQPNYRMAIITNGFAEVQQVKLAACGLTPYFERVFVSELIGYPKPRPEIFHAAVSAFHAKKKECLMIGDNPDNDIAGAREYGIDQVFFNPCKAPHKIMTTYEVASMEELRGLL